MHPGGRPREVVSFCLGMPSDAVARDCKGAPLSLELEPQLLERLRARAAADGRPLAALVRRWIEAGLGGALEQQSSAPAGPDLLARVEALEAAVADLQRPASPERVGRPVQPGELLPLPERRLTLAPPRGCSPPPRWGKP